MPDEDLVQEEAIYWATKSLHITTVVCTSMSALTHKVDPDEPVNNLIAVAHRRSCPLRHHLATCSKAARRRSGSDDDDECAPPPRKRGKGHNRGAGPTCMRHLRCRGPSVPPRRPRAEQRPLSVTMAWPCCAAGL